MSSTNPQRDFADEHVDQWSQFWSDEDGYDAEVEGALVRMQHIIQQSQRRLRELLAADPLSYEEFTTLHKLVGSFNGRATPAQLADSTGVTRAGMTSRVDRLLTAGLVTRTEDTNDRRSVVIQPTAAGKKEWDRLVNAWSDEEQTVFAALSTTEVRRLNSLLRKVILAP